MTKKDLSNVEKIISQGNFSAKAFLCGSCVIVETSYNFRKRGSETNWNKLHEILRSQYRLSPFANNDFKLEKP